VVSFNGAALFVEDLKIMRTIFLLFLLIALGSWLFLEREGAAMAQSLPELQPPQNLLETPLTLDEIVPERVETARQETQDAETEKSATNAQQRKAHELDKLFQQLKRTAKAEQAARISGQIQTLWAQSGSDTVDLLMQWAENAIAKADYPQALDFLDNVVMLKADFAEGWMRRASIHIQRHDLTLAMLDLNQVLRLEPRHYQAMAQLGLVMEMTERKSAALAVYSQALALYPQFVRLQKRLDDLLDAVGEQSL